MKNNKLSIAPFNIELTDFLKYVEENNLMSIDDVINELVAEINMGLVVPKFGLQKDEEIPDNVLKSYKKLLKKGYNRYLVNDDLIKSTISK